MRFFDASSKPVDAKIELRKNANHIFTGCVDHMTWFFFEYRIVILQGAHQKSSIGFDKQ